MAVRLATVTPPGWPRSAPHPPVSWVITVEGVLNLYGAATDRRQIVYQHARHLGLPVNRISPIERRQLYEERVRATKEQLRHR